MSEVVKYLLTPIRHFIHLDPKYSNGENDEVLATYEMIFGSLSKEQLQYLARYYCTVIYPEIREKRTSAQRDKFPSPAELQSYMTRIKKEKAAKLAVEKREEEYKKDEEKFKPDPVDEKAKNEAKEFLSKHKVGKQVWEFYYESILDIRATGWVWKEQSKTEAVIPLKIIIKKGKLEEFKKCLK